MIKKLGFIFRAYFTRCSNKTKPLKLVKISIIAKEKRINVKLLRTSFLETSLLKNSTSILKREVFFIKQISILREQTMTNSKAAEEQDTSLDIDIKKSFFKRFKLLFFIIALILTTLVSIGGSIGVTFYLTQGGTERQAQQEKVEQLEQEVAELQTIIAQQDSTLSQIAGNTDQLTTYLRHSSASSIKNIMLDQESNIQSFLIVLKASMRDLSIIIGRADDWQEDYDEQLNIAIAQSQKREQLLSLLKTGEPVTLQ